MTHYRTAIREAAKAALRTDMFFADAANVLASAKIDADTMPAWSVSTSVDDYDHTSDRLTESKVSLVVAVTLGAAPAAIEAALDDLSGKIETLILDGLGTATGAQNVQLKRTETKTGPEDKTVTGTVMMLFEVTGYLKAN